MRCQRILHNSDQCGDEALPCTERCQKHTTAITRKRNEMRGYDVQDTAVSARLHQFANAPEIFSLDFEIAVSRQILERNLASLTAGTDSESNMNATVATPIILRILEVQQKLIVSGAQLKLKLGALLSKDTIKGLATRMVEILADELEDLPGGNIICERVTTRMANEIEKARNGSDDS